eukprot:COSAG03_NODE_312_length_9111_cov_63.231392_4_plen_98_part_00
MHRTDGSSKLAQDVVKKGIQEGKRIARGVASMLEPAAKKARFGDAGQAAEPAVLVDVPPPAQGWCTAMQPARDARQLGCETKKLIERVKEHCLSSGR